MVVERAVSRPSSTSQTEAGSAREVDVVLGHPFDDVSRALVVAVDGVVGDQLEIHVPLADRHARVVSERVARFSHRSDEPCSRAEVVDEVPRMQPLCKLAPVTQVGLGDLLPPQHVHGRGPYPRFDRQRGSG